MESASPIIQESLDRAESIGNVGVVQIFTTNDLSFAAYLVMKGVKLIDARKLGKSFQFKFVDDPHISRYSISYVGSECSRFDDSIRKLKRLMKEGGSL